MSTARVAGVLLGAGLAVFLLVSARPSSSHSRLPASVRFTVPVSGELEVSAAAPRAVLAAAALVPGHRPASARFAVRNQTGKTLSVGFRARAAGRELDGLLRIRLRAGGKTLADTTLQGLRQGSALSLPLRSGAEGQVQIDAWLPGDISDGYEGRSVAVSLIPMLRKGV